MHRGKRRRLAAAGWQVGTVQEFLGLSEAEVQLIEVRLALARALRRLRAQRGLTQGALAAALGSSQSRVAKMEQGAAGVTLDLLVRGLLHLGMTPRQLGAQVARAERARAAA